MSVPFCFGQDNTPSYSPPDRGRHSGGQSSFPFRINVRDKLRQESGESFSLHSKIMCSRRLQTALSMLFSQPEGCGYIEKLSLSSSQPEGCSCIEKLSLSLSQPEGCGYMRKNFIFTVSDSLKSDTTVKKSTFKKFRMKKSPWLAVGLSAVLPGAGQFYNQSYWKVPILLGLTAYLGYQYYDNDKKYRDYRDRYSATQTTENPGGDGNLKTLREFYRNQRNDFVWYFAIVYVVNLVDAYIDAHLFDFTVKEDKIERFGKTDREYKLNVKFNF